MPNFAGALTWCRSLLARIKLPMLKLQQVGCEILEREEAKEAHKVQSYLISSIESFESNRVSDWSISVEKISVDKLCLPLLKRNASNNHLMTNFDPALV